MDYTFGLDVLFPSILTIILSSRLLLYCLFYRRYEELSDLRNFIKTIGIGEIVLDLSTISLNLVEAHYGHQVTELETVLYKLNLYLIPPALLTFVWCCTLIRPGEYDLIEGEVYEGLLDEEEISMGETSIS